MTSQPGHLGGCVAGCEGCFCDCHSESRLSHDRGADAEKLAAIRSYVFTSMTIPALDRHRLLTFIDGEAALSVPAPTLPALDVLTVALDGIEGEVREVLEAQHGDPYRALEAIGRRVIALRKALRDAV